MTHDSVPISGHPNYDPQSLRVRIPRSQVMKLPIKDVSVAELFDIENTWEFNPSYLFLKGLGKDISGHDLKYRYRVPSFSKKQQKEIDLLAKEAGKSLDDQIMGVLSSSNENSQEKVIRHVSIVSLFYFVSKDAIEKWVIRKRVSLANWIGGDWLHEFCE